MQKKKERLLQQQLKRKEEQERKRLKKELESQRRLEQKQWVIADTKHSRYIHHFDWQGFSLLPMHWLDKFLPVAAHPPALPVLQQG